MNKKSLINILFFGISLNAEYSIENAHQIAMRILGAGLLENVEKWTGDLFNTRSADGQALWEVGLSLTAKEEFQIRRHAECFRLDENNLQRVIAFLEQIIPVIEEKEVGNFSIISSSKKIGNTRFYTEILPIIKEHNEAALIVLKEFAFDFDQPGDRFGISEKERFKLYAVMLDVLMEERDFSFLTTAFFLDFYYIIKGAFYKEVRRGLNEEQDLDVLEAAIKAVTFKAQKNMHQKLDFDPTLSASGHARYDASNDIWFRTDDSFTA